MDSVRSVWDPSQPDHVFTITIVKGGYSITYPVLHYITKQKKSVYHVYEKDDCYYPVAMAADEDSGYIWVEATLVQETELSKLFGGAIERARKAIK